jgi:hypothetical protein
MDQHTVQKMDSFISVAATQGVDQAVEQHPGLVAPNEIAALKSLSPSELTKLNEINGKLVSAAKGSFGGKLPAAWTCGALC